MGRCNQCGGTRGEISRIMGNHFQKSECMEELESQKASLGDVINQELRENGPVDVCQAALLDDLRPYVKHLVDLLKKRTVTS